MDQSHHAIECVAQKFRSRGSGCLDKLTLAKEVQWEIKPYQEDEAANIVEKMDKIIAVISYSGGQIIRPVALHMVMFDVMIEIAVPRMTHQRVSEVGK